MSRLVSIKRITKELVELNDFTGSNNEDKFIATANDNNITMWKVMMHCPKGTKYHGKPLETHIQFPDDYPFKPPQVKFINKPSHPNIRSDGSVCVDILQDKWSPALSATKIYVSVMSLLIDEK